MDVIPYKLKKFSKIVSKLCIQAQIPVYNSKYSNKIFTNIQHLYLLVAKNIQTSIIEVLLSRYTTQKYQDTYHLGEYLILLHFKNLLKDYQQ